MRDSARVRWPRLFRIPNPVIPNPVFSTGPTPVIEHRRSPRKPPGVIIQVTNTLTGEVFGRLGNISAEGMMLVASRPVVDDALYQLLFHLPDEHGRLHPIEVGVHEQWSEEANVPGQHWVGFRFIDIAPADAAVLRDWLNGSERLD
jgi:hypothetical protein